MNCSSFDRWLDAGMPGAGSKRALAHAAGCKVCAPALAEARAVETALRTEASAVGASIGFVDAVMARVEAEAARSRRVKEAARRVADTPWWLRLFADPVSAVSVTVAVAVGAIATIEPGWIAAGATAIVAFGHRAGESVAAWPALDRPSPALLAAAAAVAPLLALLATAVYRSLERAIVLMAGDRRR